ncbi:hypothetical protein [Promicromonospora sp. AC04]|uniref:hypothetical protein n=1 Tax=Promicromonospora sp. AC04 TaxID=2135723 RepID=UPI0011B247E8|nr:hypothetical protein [Promicromonospora sp. AC04]
MTDQEYVTTSKRPEEAGRTIRVVRQNHAATTPSFIVQNIAYPTRPDLVGRETTMSAKTLTSSAWRSVAAQPSPPGAATPTPLDELLGAIQTQHDQENPEEHTGCHTLVLLAGIRAALTECDRATTGAVDPTAVREAIAAGMHAHQATEAPAH